MILSVKKGMKTTVLLFKGDPEKDLVLIESLNRRGIKITQAKSLSRMHILLASRNFDAILVNQDTIDLYGLSPSRHLWEYRSPLCIIPFSVSADGKIKTSVFSLPETVSAAHQKPEKKSNLESILAAFDIEIAVSLPSPEKDIRDDMLHPNTIINGLKALLHKKLHRILVSLVNAGSRGILIDTLTNEIWGQNARSRKKDIQIYMSKLRAVLADLYGTQYRIILENNLYMLVDEFNRPASATLPQNAEQHIFLS